MNKTSAAGSLTTLYNNIFEKYSDPRVKAWPLMDNVWYTAAIIIVYLVLVLIILPKYMKNRKPYNLKKIIQVYNIIQVILCATIIYRWMTAGWIQNRYSWRCQPVDYSNDPDALVILETLYYHYLLRMAEFFETICFILRKKDNQASALHLYHHVSTVMIAYSLVKYFGGGTFVLHATLNMMVHIIMYTYYYLASLGPQWQKMLADWKPLITIAQMTQFVLIIAGSSWAVVTPCKVTKSFFAFFIPNMMFLFYMFYRFYQTAYKKPVTDKKNE